MILHLPEPLILSGLEVPVVAAAYPDIVGHGFSTPSLDMPGISWFPSGMPLIEETQGKSHECAICFNVDDYRAGFGCRGLYTADERHSGGVSVLG
jgi:hypothetical protein